MLRCHGGSVRTALTATDGDGCRAKSSFAWVCNVGRKHSKPTSLIVDGFGVQAGWSSDSLSRCQEPGSYETSSITEGPTYTATESLPAHFITVVTLRSEKSKVGSLKKIKHELRDVVSSIGRGFTSILNFCTLQRVHENGKCTLCTTSYYARFVEYTYRKENRREVFDVTFFKTSYTVVDFEVKQYYSHSETFVFHFKLYSILKVSVSNNCRIVIKFVLNTHVFVT